MAPYYSFLPYSHTFGKIRFHLDSRHTTCFPKKSLHAFPCLQMATASLSPQKRVHSRAQEKQKISRDGRLIACRGGHSGQNFVIVAVQNGREWPIRYWHFFAYIYTTTATHLFTSAQKQMFGRGISEGLPPPLEPKPVPKLPMPPPRRPRAQILREFDTLSENYHKEAQPAPRNIPAWYKNAVQEIQNIVVNGRGQQIIKRHYLSNLIHSLAGQILDRIKWGMANLFRINYSYYNRLRNIETNKKLPWLEEGMKIPWFPNLREARGWSERQETARLENETFTRPNAKFVFAAYMSVQISVRLDNQTLHVGEGCLSEWLCTKKGLYALDTFNNNLCVFCCLVVHKEAHKKNNLRITGKWHKNILPHMKFQMRRWNCSISSWLRRISTKK